MAKQRNAVRAGLFMLVSLALVIFVIIAISGAARFTQSFNTYFVAFSLTDDVGGLRVGDDVRLGGVKVGSIRDIQIRRVPGGVGDDIPQDAPAVVLLIDVPSRYPVTRDAYVFVQKGLTGAATINIDALGAGESLASSQYLRGHPDPFSAFTKSLGSMGPELRQIVANVKVGSQKLNNDLDKFGHTADSFTSTGLGATSTIQDLHVRLPEIVTRYNDLVAAAIQMLDTVRDLIGPGNTDFKSTLANVTHVTADLREKLPDLLDQMRGILRKVDTSVTRANSALATIQAAVINTKDITATARSVVVENKSKFDGMIASLKTTGDNLKYASVEIRHSPWRLIYQPKPDEVANLNTYDSVRQFAEGASSLDDAAAALRDAVNDKNADPEKVKQLMNQLNVSFSRFQDIQQKLWKDIKQ
ncbi:MAG: MlaD family protein [Planctomycetota bacterium]|nr:MlaD family protein [Planctomycetota bacterium]